MKDLHDLERFVEAQEPVYEHVRAELRAGRKSTHWMWFVFPQVRGLGQSPTARRFAIASLEEARAYLDHPVLGPRLLECTRLVNAIEGRTLGEIFGYPDDLKFRSSMTLFAAVEGAGRALFDAALEKYCRGERDGRTLELLACAPS